MPKDEFAQSPWPILRVAYLYYIENYSLSEISVITKLSMSTITRMLSRARSKGVVTINIESSQKRCLEMASAITKQFNLDFTVVSPLSYYGIKQEEYDRRQDNLALEGARFVQHILKDGDILGLGCNLMMRKLANYLNPCHRVGAGFVLLSGMLQMKDDNRDIKNIVTKLRRTVGDGPLFPIPKGLAADSDQLNRWMEQKKVKEYTDTFDRVTISVGNCQPVFSNGETVSILAENLKEYELLELKEKHAVGEFLLRFYTDEGREADTQVSKRTFGIDLEHYKKIPLKIVISHTEEGAKILLPMLKNKLVDVLILDEYGAETLLQLL